MKVRRRTHPHKFKIKLPGTELDVLCAALRQYVGVFSPPSALMEHMMEVLNSLKKGA